MNLKYYKNQILTSLQQMHMTMITVHFNDKKYMHTAWASLMKSTISCCNAAWTFGAPFSSQRHTEWTDLQGNRIRHWITTLISHLTPTLTQNSTAIITIKFLFYWFMKQK